MLGLVVGRAVSLGLPRLGLPGPMLLTLEEGLAAEPPLDPGDEAVGPAAGRLGDRPAAAFLLPLLAENGPPPADHALVDSDLRGDEAITATLEGSAIA